MEEIIEVLILGVILSADSFSAALAMGARDHNLKDSLKFAFSSGSAEAAVSFLGAVTGAKVIAQIDSFDHWISFILLCAVASHMAFEGYSDFIAKNDKQDTPKNFHHFGKILIVSFATSLDAFAVGVSLGVANKNLPPYVLSIGVFAFLSTIWGMKISKYASKKLGPLFNIFGALILLSLASKFLYDGL